ncbi:hypothetical protein [Cryobacterium sp. 10C2]|uniref:hypothetical protein n=1 Tax=Cryobacterium sp. 10C2 TaxID=3048576 RepID=UPI003A5998B2
MHPGDPGWQSKFDRDGDGCGCRCRRESGREGGLAGAGVEDARHRIPFCLRHPEAVGRLDRDLPGDVVAPV